MLNAYPSPSSSSSSSSSVGLYRCISGQEADELMAITSCNALSDLWSHTDQRGAGGVGSGTSTGRSGVEDSITSYLRRTLVVPMVTALFVGDSEIVPVALKGFIQLSSRALATKSDLTERRRRFHVSSGGGGGGSSSSHNIVITGPCWVDLFV